ncbi:MAG: DUF3105 domain-containing protein [Sporichthyaceae bacterium]
MAKKSKTGESRQDRKFRVEEMKRAQKAAERRKNLIVVGVCIVVAGGLIAIPVVGLATDSGSDDVAQLGASTADAACDPTIVDPTEGASDHVKAGTRVEYDLVPPSSGRHNESPITVSRRGWYTTKDVPAVEQLVHNLEHGYTIAWYDPGMADEEKDTLEEISSQLRSENVTRKFIATPWDTSRGAFPAGKPLALVHWGAGQKAADASDDRGYRQFCGRVSGAAIAAFMNQYPAADSPEPNTP